MAQHRSSDRSTCSAIVAAVKGSSLTRAQKRRLLVLMRLDAFCELMCDRVEAKLIEEGAITASQRWDAQSWDWDAVIERIKNLVDYMIEIAPELIAILLQLIDVFTDES